MSGENIAALAAYQDQRDGSASAYEPVPDDQLIKRMSDVTSRTIRWAWRGRLALGYITVQTGEEGLGKSVFAAWLAARATRGELDGDWHHRPVDVLIVASEDGLEDTWQPRLAVAGADLERVASLNLDALPIDWNIRDGIDALRQAVLASGAKLLLLDALFDHMPPTNGGENINSPTFVRGALAPLKQLVKELGIVAVISLHPPKARGVAFRDLVQASQAFSAVPRIGLYFGWHPDDAEDDPGRRRVLVRGKGNIGRNPGALEFRVVGQQHVHGDGLVDEREVVEDVEPSDVTLQQLTARTRGGSEDTHSSKAVEAADLLRERLSGGDWHASAAIREELHAAGLNSASVVTRAKELAGVESRKTASEWEWRSKIPSKIPTPPIYPAMESWPQNSPNPQCSREDSKIPPSGTTESWVRRQDCGHDAPRWRVNPVGTWLCDGCYPHPNGGTPVEWEQQLPLTGEAA